MTYSPEAEEKVGFGVSGLFVGDTDGPGVDTVGILVVGDALEGVGLGAFDGPWLGLTLGLG